MKVSVHGTSHAEMGIKNQDSCLELISTDGKSKVKIVCDGCTNVKANNPETFSKTHNEIGSGLFCMKYSLLENPFDFSKFEENANLIMQQMLDFARFSSETRKDINNEKMIEFIAYNYCFTIFACFETEKEFVVYHLGDGVIIIQNEFGNISYIERKFGKFPPYLVNNFLLPEKVDFTKFVFDKEVKNVGVASDGVMPLLEGAATNAEKRNFDNILSNARSLPNFNYENSVRNFIKALGNTCHDDTTIVF